MSDSSSPEGSPPSRSGEILCRHCLTANWSGAPRCRECGRALESANLPANGPVPEATKVAAPVADDLSQPGDKPGKIAMIRSTMIERQSPVTRMVTLFFALVTVVVAALVLRFPPTGSFAVFPTTTPIPPSPTRYSVIAPSSIATVEDTPVPTSTPVPLPSETPRPPRYYTVRAGDTLFGVSLLYNINVETIASANDMELEDGLVISEELAVPWPSATPPLEAVEFSLDGESLYADPSDCDIYEITIGDTLFEVALNAEIDLSILMKVNRLTDESILHPGDTICIPDLLALEEIPPTPGPSPTPTATKPPRGTKLLYPADGASISESDQVVLLQWIAVKNLEENEWYMVELTDLSQPDAHSQRGFTQQTALLVPDGWLTSDGSSHIMRWRVSIVRVIGQRQDESFIYTYGGESSVEARFSWRGAEPNAVPDLNAGG